MGRAAVGPTQPQQCSVAAGLLWRTARSCGAAESFPEVADGALCWSLRGIPASSSSPGGGAPLSSSFQNDCFSGPVGSPSPRCGSFLSFTQRLQPRLPVWEVF